MKDKEKVKMAERHEEQSDKKGGPSREDKEDERGIRKRWTKEGEEIERTKDFFFFKKTKENSTNQIAVFKSRDHLGERKMKISIIRRITKL